MQQPEFVRDLYKTMAYYGFSDIWYSNPWPIGSSPTEDIPCYRWHVGVWTGPHRDMLCLKQCLTNDEAHAWISPAGEDIQDAIKKAIARLKELRDRPYN
jgi:hypothetical protein